MCKRKGNDVSVCGSIYRTGKGILRDRVLHEKSKQKIKYVSEKEMMNIMSNRSLLKSIKRGLADARQRKGRLVA
jgi:hypothetical protein